MEMPKMREIDKEHLEVRRLYLVFLVNADGYHNHISDVIYLGTAGDPVRYRFRVMGSVYNDIWEFSDENMKMFRFYGCE